MKRTDLPCHALFDELQNALIPIIRDLPQTHSLLKWVKTTQNGEEKPINLSWMLTNKMDLSHEKQVEKISSLQKSTLEFSRPLKELMGHILQFSSFKHVEKSLIVLHKAYLDMPSIETELHLLYLGTDLLQDKSLATKLLQYTEKLNKLQGTATELKKALLSTLIDNLSFNLEENKLGESWFH